MLTIIETSSIFRIWGTGFINCKVCLLSLYNDRAITQCYNAEFSIKLGWSDVVDKLDKKRSNDFKLSLVTKQERKNVDKCLYIQIAQ